MVFDLINMYLILIYVSSSIASPVKTNVDISYLS